MWPLSGAYKARGRGAASEDLQQPPWCPLGASRFLSSSSSSRVSLELSLGRWILERFPSKVWRRRGGGAAPRTASAVVARTWKSRGRRVWLWWRRSPAPCCSCASGPSHRGRPCRPSCSRGNRCSASCAAYTAAVRSGGAAAASEEYPAASQEVKHKKRLVFAFSLKWWF